MILQQRLMSIQETTTLNPDSDTTTTLDYEYFLPRIDKLVLSRDRQFEVIKGKSQKESCGHQMMKIQ